LNYAWEREEKNSNFRMENRVSLRNLIYQAWKYSAWKKYHGKQLKKDNQGLMSIFPLCPSVDCADIVLNCLFCRFHDMVSILPECCQGLTNHCWGSYRHVDHTRESLHNDDDDSCVELDCGLFGNCHDASDCLELAMEVSEICYH
uniref:MyoD family inhibitor domain containing 2 n=1 Tax=Xiphophorus maculatus TaxID=8083 RepID=A0A3B5QW45_XIPMA